MNEADPKATPTARQRVTVFLAFLTSEPCLQACHRFLPPEELAFALCRLWFDEIYVPGLRYLDGLKGDRSGEAVRRFQACFTPEEAAALERFHRFFELRLEMLPAAARGRAAFPQNDTWRNILKDAAYVLEELEADPEQLRCHLACLAQSMALRDGTGQPPEAPLWRALLDAAGRENGGL